MAGAETVRFATFNASLNRGSEGALINDLSTPDNAQAQAVAEIIQRSNPDVLLLNEFDYDPNGTAAELFQQNYLGLGQNGAAAVEYPYVYLAPSNTGIASGFDLDNDGQTVTTPGSGAYGNDAFGFGLFPGQFGMVLLSKYPILQDQVRTFQNFLWKDLPGALLPDNPATPAPNDFYSAAELEAFRLSSKSHWDVPIEVNGEVVHVLASHPTPPVFDGPEDRNGRRNFDEIRFWSDYITPGAGGYIYDDQGGTGGLDPNARFVIMGDQNSDPFDGDSIPGAIQQLLYNPAVNITQSPASAGGPDAAARQGQNNLTQLGDPLYDTADFAESAFGGPGNLRADYVLPSQNLELKEAAVFWPTSADPQFDLVGDFPFPSSDHRLVYADVAIARPGANQNRQSVSAIEFLGDLNFATGLQFGGTEVGGLSGLTYDAQRNVYYALSDDRSSDARFYTLGIDLSDGSLDAGDIQFQDVTFLTTETGDRFANGVLDPEGIALSSLGTLFISSEGDANQGIAPFVNEFSLTGQQIRELPVPDPFLPTADRSSGIRNNLAFESLTLTPNQRFLYTATENSLFQDGPQADIDTGSLSRILKYDLVTGQPAAQFVYEVEAVPDAPTPADAFRTNGLVELLAIDNNGTFLALERGFSVGAGNTVKLYEVNSQGALDVNNQLDLFWESENIPFEIDPPVQKRLLLDVEADLGIAPDNLEGIALGPKLADGRQSFVIVSDNNFSPTQATQFLSFALDFSTTPAVLPVLETLPIVDDATFPVGSVPIQRGDDDDEDQPSTQPTALLGDADDPAVWVNPYDRDRSVVIGTLKDGGLATFNLQGEVLQVIAPQEFGSDRYNNVDVIYGFGLRNPVSEDEEEDEIDESGGVADLAIASDRANDALAIFSIEAASGKLTDVTSDLIPDSIFGVDDAEATAYGLAAYKSPVSGKSYVFVTQADGNQVAQLELVADGSGGVSANVVRMLSLPVPTGDPTDSQSEGIVVDQELGLLYVALENEVGILKFSAEPTGGNDFSIVQPIGRSELVPDIEGLSIYYGPNGTGYLIANSQGDSSYAVFSREGTNEYLGSFIIGDNGAIDQVNESDGLEVISTPLGSAFPFGLMIVQDGANDPQVVVQDDEELENVSTNFKFVPWESVANAFPNPLDIAPGSYDPRHPKAQSLVNGVASGDTTQKSTVLWARSTLPGEVTFEYAPLSKPKQVRRASATVTDINQPVKVEIKGLRADTEYVYRVIDAGGDTEVGRFETAAKVGKHTGLSFGVAGDWRGEIAPYPAIGNVVEQRLAFFVEHGDTIYADVPSPALLNPDGSFKSQAETLNEFRAKHAEVYGSRLGENFWAELRASTSILATIDDHEVTNDFSGGAPAVSDPRFAETTGLINDTQLYENGLQAFQEYNPIRNEFYGATGDDRTAGERKLYRHNTYGSDAATFVLDSRSFRDPELQAADTTNPADVARFLGESLLLDRQFLGDVQLDDLKQDLLTADDKGITWKFVMLPEPAQELGLFNTDAYEGYANERTELLKFVNDNSIDNVVFVAADIHATFVNNLTYQEVPGGERIATSVFEITTGSVGYQPPFGEVVVDVATATGLLTPEQKAFYELLPIAPDTDDIVNDKDDFLTQAFNNLAIAPLGYDPIGLDDNLPQADGLINAKLLQGDYVSAHTYGWTQFDIDRTTQKLLVTTWGIDGYTQAELLANPDEILGREPRIVSQFEVTPNGFEPKVKADKLLAGGKAGKGEVSDKSDGESKTDWLTEVSLGQRGLLPQATPWDMEEASPLLAGFAGGDD
ncbi:MAG: phytase [Leptolyngbyaceae cyanobacterium SL_1_1]|nr:phytase [Leptolyngbyaceae cyanobacterium RM1_1_2]NJO11079.1 phytase [Leptolyngbyaceae cyanobacterium SL_1_1]